MKCYSIFGKKAYCKEYAPSILFAIFPMAKILIYHCILNKVHHSVLGQLLMWTNWGGFVSLNYTVRLLSIKLFQLIKWWKSEAMC